MGETFEEPFQPIDTNKEFMPEIPLPGLIDMESRRVKRRVERRFNRG